MSAPKELQEEAKDFTILYAEDNDALRNNAAKLLKKFFHHVHVAADGKEGYELFKKHRPQIVITDIKMPHMSGMKLSSLIHQSNPQTKIIVMTAFDDKEYLYKAIELGIFRYLKKPVTLSALTEALHDAIIKIGKEKELELFHDYMRNIFDYQSSLIVMFKNGEMLLSNQPFKEFFEIENVDEFKMRYGDIGRLLLEHDGFLYNKQERNWYEEISANDQKLYHAKIKNSEEEVRHFFLKYQKVPEDDSLAILSFDDVTELNLLKLFDNKKTKSDEIEQDSKAIFNLLEAVHRNGAKVQLYNYYKGLSITNHAFVVDVGEDMVSLKTNFTQQKAVQFEQQTIILSDAFPYALACNKIVNMNLEKQSISLRNLKFISSSPVDRATIRLVPEDKHTVSLFLKESKYQGTTRIEDISLDAVRLRVDALPPGLEPDMEMYVDMVLEMDKTPLILNTKARLFKKVENKHSFTLVLLFDFKEKQKADLIRYMTKRQMAIIREFKGL